MSPLNLFGKKKKEWFIRSADKDVSGPFSDQELKDKASDGSLTPDDKVSNDQKKWTLAARVKLVKGLFSKTPAPQAVSALDLPAPEGSSDSSEASDVVVTQQAGDAMEALLQDSPAPGNKDAADKAIPVKALPAEDENEADKPIASAVKVAPVDDPPAAKVNAVEEKNTTPTANTPAAKAAAADNAMPDQAKASLSKDSAKAKKADDTKPKSASQVQPKPSAKKQKPIPKGAAPKLKTPTQASEKETVKAAVEPNPLSEKTKPDEASSTDETKAVSAGTKRQFKGKKPKPKPAPAPQESTNSPASAPEQKSTERASPKSAKNTEPSTSTPATKNVVTDAPKPHQSKPAAEAQPAAAKPRAEDNQLVDLERQVEDLSAQLENANDQANREKRSLATKVEVLESKLQAIKDREAAIQRDHEHDKNKLKRETEAVARKLASVSEDLEARKNQLFTLRNDSRDEIQALRTAHAELSDKNESLQNSLKEEQELMAELRRVHHVLKTTTEQEKDKLSEQIHHLQENAESSATILEGAWNQLEKQKQQIADMFTREDLERREAELQSETERARSDAAGISARLEQHKAQATKREDSLVKKLEEKDAALAALETSLSQTRADLDEQRKQEAILSSKTEDLSASLDELEKKLARADSDFKQQTEELSNVRDRLTQTEKKNAELVKDLKGSRDALAEAEKAGAELADTLGGQINAIRKELLAQSEGAPAKPSGALPEADIQRLKQRILELRDDAERAVVLKTETEQLRSSLEKVETQSNTFKRDLSEAEEKYMILEQKLVLTESRETRLIKRLDQVESLMKLLRAQME